MDHRIVCPNCHKQGTVKSNNGIPDGAKLRCAGCGHTYSYQESYDLQPEANPSPGTAPTSGLIPITPQAKPKQPTRSLTRSTLIGEVKGDIASGKLEKGGRDSNLETFHCNPAG
jgi:predicted Zn finger-like uncharacterized protein